MRSVETVIDAFGGPQAVAVALDLPPTTAASWRQRKSIPVDYWPKLVEAARQRDIDLDYDALVSIHTNVAPTKHPEAAG